MWGRRRISTDAAQVTTPLRVRDLRQFDDDILSMANSSSCGFWCLVSTATVLSPGVGVDIHTFRIGRFDWGLTFQRGMSPIVVVVVSEIRQFLFQIRRRPEQKLV